jgi:hypothetical protein
MGLCPDRKLLIHRFLALASVHGPNKRKLLFLIYSYERLSIAFIPKRKIEKGSGGKSHTREGFLIFRPSCPVFPAVRSFQLSGRSSCPVVLAVRSFQLSGRPTCPVVPAVRSFQLSGRSSCPVVPAIRSFQLYGSPSCPVVSVRSFWLFSGRSSLCKQIKLKKETRTDQFTVCCLF